ncbi:MAG: hypothetical protein OCC49_07390 [Fibrobacterales bacterium]
MKLALIIPLLLLLLLGCSYVPPNYSAMLIQSRDPSNTMQSNIGFSGTNLGINIGKPNQADSAALSEYPKTTFTQSVFSFDYFINTESFHFAPNLSNTNTSLGMGFDYDNTFLVMVTPGVHFTGKSGTNLYPTSLDVKKDYFVNFHTSVNLSSTKGNVILISNDIFQSQFIETSRYQEFSNHVTPYMNKLALSLFFYDRAIFAGLELSMINSYNFDYYGAGVMFTFGFK